MIRTLLCLPDGRRVAGRKSDGKIKTTGREATARKEGKDRIEIGRRAISKKGNPARESLSACHSQFSVRRLTTARLTRIPAQVDPNRFLRPSFFSFLPYSPSQPWIIRSPKKEPRRIAFKSNYTWKVAPATSNYQPEAFGYF